MKTPPKAKTNEMQRASVCLNRCRKEFVASELGPDWLLWVAESLLEGVPKDSPPTAE